MTMRETIETSICLVGGGPANLSCFLHLIHLIKKHNQSVQRSGKGRVLDLEENVLMVEKGKYIGSHNLSGAILDRSVEYLLSSYTKDPLPIECRIKDQRLYFLSRRGKTRLPIPYFLNNKSNYLVSLEKICRWMAGHAEEAGAMILEETAASSLRYGSSGIEGIQVGDKGKNRDGSVRCPGETIQSKLAVIGDGSNGKLSSDLIRRKGLSDPEEPSIYELGIREVWEFAHNPLKPGQVLNFMGYPFERDLSGGAFVYSISETTSIIGLIVHLNSRSPYLDPHEELRKLKAHPFLKSILNGGRPVGFGARTIPCGGYFTIPRLYTEGAILVGDSANLVDSRLLKGIHLAMNSGIYAAETAFECLKRMDFSAENLASYQDAVYRSRMLKEMWKARNFTKAIIRGLGITNLSSLALQTATNGVLPLGRVKHTGAHESTSRVDSGLNPGGEGTHQGTSHKMQSVYLSGTMHSETGESHIEIMDDDMCETCERIFKKPCTRFCPAQVYEDRGDGLAVNHINCLHCRTCDLKCPFLNIQWKVPEGGEGPVYRV